MNAPVDYSATVPLDVFAADLAKTCRKWFRISEDGDQAGSDRHQSIAHEIIEGTAEFINELKGPLTVEVWSVTIENPSNDTPATFVVETEAAAYNQVRAYCDVNDDTLTDGDMLAELTDGSGYAIYIDSHQVNITLPSINSAPLDQTALAS
ncbi:Uncharacterised protein [Mycobacteroides abscessus subsp. abscessus]|uniref:hypothetical protein n=1 Tax=Mycobacteroides abscessus TaxID=36809 RepID=UPI00092B5050|nr:hypothetical protein [Mycobacteroides abscessus]SHS18951.1 Uncharacterised protein [Mycobacteroides abscessus subsp. abscessus]